MDEAEEKKHGVSAVEAALSNHKTRQSRAKSDASKAEPIEFTSGGKVYEPRSPAKQERPEPPEPSGVSMRSDMSKKSPIEFRKHHRYVKQSEHFAMDEAEEKKHGVSGVEAVLSKHKDRQSSVKRHENSERPDSSLPTCVSLNSDASKAEPIEFTSRGKIYEPSPARQERPEPHKPNGASIRRVMSKMEPSDFRKDHHYVKLRSDQHHQPKVESVFKRLEANMVAFIKNELKKLEKVLGAECAEDSEWMREEEELMRGEEDEQRQSKRKSFVNLTLNFMRSMKEEELADRLHSKTHAMICQRKLKSKLTKKFQSLFEGSTKAGNPSLLNQIYTELHITEGECREINDQHEARLIEAASWKPASSETTIRCEDIFKALPGKEEPVRTLVTKGVAGIGKTVLTQKFTMDWAEDKANQDIQFIFPLTFRELNLLKTQNVSLVELLHYVFAETKEAGIRRFEEFQVVFIFDGLDECRLPLDFKNNVILTDVTESTSVDVLLTNLIRGNLLPSARLWITTRPASANQIPPEYVDMVTEVRGFTDPQKEEYFRKRFRDKKQASRIISHIKTSRSLQIMCHIPVFCWITATVLEDVLKTGEGVELPKTLTKMYIHFLVVQTKLRNIKYDGGAAKNAHWSPESRKMIEALGKLAFEQLQKGNLIFYDSDLTECGIDIRAASVYSGVFTQMFKEERGLYQDKVFCFIHLTVQEFLAALHVHLTFFNSGVNLLSEEQSTTQTPRRVNDKGTVKLYQTAVDGALQSPKGHLDLFLRFLLGLSVQTNQSLLQGLLMQTTRTSQTKKEVVQYIRTNIGENLSPERSINLFHCLNELNDNSLVEEIQQYLNSGSLSADNLSSAQWSALVFILLSSGKNLDVFDLKKYSATEESLLWLLPVVKASSKSLLSGCNILERGCKCLASILSSKSSSLIELDLSYNVLQDRGVKLLCADLESPHCKLEVLRLSGCKLSWRSCKALCSVLRSQTSNLRELDLNNNDLQDSGVMKLSDGLESPHCTLESLRLSGCNLSNESCEALASVFSSPSCSLIELDISNNDLHDSGVKLLSAGFKSPHCKLQTLSLSGCLLTEEGCSFVVSALSSNPSHLRNLDLSYNNPGDLGVRLLSAHPYWRQNTVRICNAGIQRLTSGLRKYACELIMDPNTAHRNLCLLEYNIIIDEQEEWPYPDRSERFECWYQLLCKNGLTGRCYWEVNWMGLVSIGVTYIGIKRTGFSDKSCIGGNNSSWSLDCSPVSYSAWHNNKVKVIHQPSPSTVRDRVAVYLDWPAGTLSFYKVSDNLSHIHTFHCTFTEPLYPAFRIRSEFTYGQSNLVSLCQMDEED